MQSKRELRPFFLAARRAVTGKTKQLADATICEALRALPAYRAADCVALYASDGEEPRIEALFGEAGKRYFLPRYSAEERVYELVEVRDWSRDLVTGRYGLLEPRPELAAATAELVAESMFFVVPAVACTRTGVRLGRGGGFYDRLLTGAKYAAAVVYDCCLAPELPCEPHDLRMNFVVTERSVSTIA